MEFAEAGLENLKRYGRKSREIAWGFVTPNMSPVMFFLDFVFYPPVIIICLAVGFWHIPAITAVTLVCGGIFTWTLAEYSVHRFVLHRIAIFSKLHQAHHDESLELIGTPTLYSAFFLVAVAYLPAAVLTDRYTAACWFAGLLIGYVYYVFVHYAVHHLSSGGFQFMKSLKRQHSIHHHGASESNFGVTTDLWDRVFRTKTNNWRGEDKH